jgi:hypothetical protein
MDGGSLLAIERIEEKRLKRIDLKIHVKALINFIE